VIGGQGSAVFLTGTSWFCDFLAISGFVRLECRPQAMLLRAAFPSPVRFFYKPLRKKMIYSYLVRTGANYVVPPLFVCSC
jgi:hypothetical protein